MKSNRMLWGIFLGMLMSGVQLLGNPQLLQWFLLGVIIVFISLQFGKHLKRLKYTGVMLGIVLVVLTGFSTIGAWIVLISVIGYLFLFLRRLTRGNWKIKASVLGENQSYLSVKTVEPTHRYEKEEYEWIGTYQVGKDTFEWDDININQLAGDTIIDLGNTVLPLQENVIMVRMGAGRVRVLVPYGVGVMIHHSSFVGQLIFQGDAHELNNATVKCYSDNYASSVKKIKIISSVMIGSLEVIES